MNKPLTLISILTLTLAFVSCDSTNPAAGRRDTVFHSAEDNPRSGPQGSSRYGHGGTHSPEERKKKTTRRRSTTTASETRKKRRSNSDSNGIVKPRDLDPEPERSEEPEIVANDPKPKIEEPTPDPTPAPAPSGDAPYAEAVPGKTGLVYSPFVASKKDGLVNVTDENNVPLPPGTEVTDPHTGKTFRVP